RPVGIADRSVLRPENHRGDRSARRRLTARTDTSREKKMTTDTLTDLQSGFKEAMAHMCAPVTVITTMDGPHPHGTTVSALMSLSMDPLLIAVAMATSSESLAAVKRTGVFAVNVLGAHQQDAALRFATKGDDKF